jgi:hypothetical protein
MLLERTAQWGGEVCPTAVLDQVDLLTQVTKTSIDKIAKRIVRRDETQGLSNGLDERLDGLCSNFTRKLLDLGKGFCNGREVRRIRWQKEQLTAFGAQQLLNTTGFVSSQIVQDDNIAWSQRWEQDLFDEGFKNSEGDAAFNDLGFRHAV